jgi:DNA anti-recombination protein RmuC
MSKQYKIIKATYPKLIGVIFECAILKDVQPPKWFQEFEKRVNARFEHNDARFDTLEERINARFERIETTLQEQAKFNTEVRGFMKRTDDHLSRIDKVIRINNLKTE